MGHVDQETMFFYILLYMRRLVKDSLKGVRIIDSDHRYIRPRVV